MFEIFTTNAKVTEWFESVRYNNNITALIGSLNTRKVKPKHQCPIAAAIMIGVSALGSTQ